MVDEIIGKKVGMLGFVIPLMSLKVLVDRIF